MQAHNDVTKVIGTLPSTPNKLRRTEWRKIISDWKGSGLSQATFCKTHQLKPHQFSYYRKILLKEANTSSSGFAAVKIREPSPASRYSEGVFVLQLRQGEKLLIPHAYNADALKNLLTLLGVC